MVYSDSQKASREKIKVSVIKYGTRYGSED